MKDVLISPTAWDEIWEKTEFAVAAHDDPVRQWIEAHFRGGTGSCLELGCFPGRYLAVFGDMGYELSGIDLTPRVRTHLKSWLVSRNYRIGEIVQDDVFTHSWSRQFDVVCSFGLIEHFAEWPKLLSLHSNLVADGGQLLIATPNFRGWVQRLLHQCLDSENLRQHNLDAMVPREWAEILRPRGFEITECGYFGTFDFWVGTQKRGFLMGKIVKAVAKFQRGLSPLWQRLPPSIAAYSPYCGLVARRISRVSAVSGCGPGR